MDNRYLFRGKRLDNLITQQMEILNSNPQTFEERIQAFEAVINLAGVAFKINLAIHDGNFAYIDAENNKKMAIKKEHYSLKNLNEVRNQEGNE